MPVCAGATLLVQRYTVGSRSAGVLARIALKAAVRQLMISRRLVVPAIVCESSNSNSYAVSDVAVQTRAQWR